MSWVIAFLTLSGFSVTFWGCVGALRFLFSDSFGRWKRPFRSKGPWSVSRDEVAVVVPAHNEEVTIRETIASLSKHVRPDQVYVGSDASTDRTVEIARETGCHVLDLRPNRGKAKVIAALLEEFSLFDRAKAVLIVDADTVLSERYFENALPRFDDPRVVAIGGHANPHWRRHILPRWDMFFTAYRVRLYWILQLALRYGQTWKYTNVTTIVPGFASMYRTDALRRINITAPNLVIEDFNMTFEVQHKRLGSIAYHPSIAAFSHEPVRLRDYVRQVRRWNLGFWQTVRRHGLWPSFFCLSLSVFIFETSLFSFVVLFILPITSFMGVVGVKSAALELPLLPLVVRVRLTDVLLGGVAADYLLTCIIALILRRWQLLLYGLGFFFLRIVDAYLYFFAIPLAFFVKSDGTWKSPARKAQ